MSQNADTSMTVHEQLNQVYQIAAEADFDNYIRFVDDELMVVVPNDVIENNDDVDIRDITSLDAVTVTEDNTIVFEFKIWLVVRHPTTEEYEAAKQGVIDKQRGAEYTESFDEIEQKFYDLGFEKANVDGSDDADKVIGSELPNVLLYHRDDGYSGPKYFGNALNYNRMTDFDPHVVDEMITNGEMIGSAEGEYPDIECEVPNKTRYKFVFATE